ncbi:MAG: DNA polymerase III subunit [Actinomycetota bacterium]
MAEAAPGQGPGPRSGPTELGAIIGHREVLDFLIGELTAPGHAYLMVGPSGVGKATIARYFSQLLLCPEQGRHIDPCRSCRRVNSGNHPDLIDVEPEGRTSLGADQARAVVRQAALTPVESTRRVFLFEEAGLMTEQAANALLKTLEEPSGSVVFVLVADSEEDFPPTVASRCRTIRFGRVPDTELVDGLVARGVDPARADVLSLVSGGRPGLALALTTRDDLADLRQAWLGLPMRVSGRPGDGFSLAEEIMAKIDPLAGELSISYPTADQRERAKKRASQSLLAGGLEILASFYLDAASLQLGGPIRNRDVSLADLTRVDPVRAVAGAGLTLDAVVDLAGNLRPLPVLALLFTALGGE